MHRVVSKQNVFLHRIDLDAGVMLNARTRDIKALGTKMKKRLFRTVEGIPFAINDCIIDLIQRRTRNRPAFLRGFPCVLDVLRWNALVGLANKDIARIIPRQASQLLVQVVPNDVRLGNYRRVLARLVDVAKRLGTIDGLPFADIHCDLGINHIAIVIKVS